MKSYTLPNEKDSIKIKPVKVFLDFFGNSLLYSANYQQTIIDLKKSSLDLMFGATNTFLYNKSGVFNSHLFLLYRTFTQRKNNAWEFGLGAKYSDNMYKFTRSSNKFYRKIGVQTNINYMFFLNSQMFMKVGLILPLLRAKIKQDTVVDGYMSYYHPAYPYLSGWLSFSVGFQSTRRKATYLNLSELKPYHNAIGLTSFLTPYYERLLYHRRTSAWYAHLNPGMYVFKAYTKSKYYSYLLRPRILFNYTIISNKKLIPEIGFGASYLYFKTDINGDNLHYYDFSLQGNIGFSMKVTNNTYLKINYLPIYSLKSTNDEYGGYSIFQKRVGYPLKYYLKLNEAIYNDFYKVYVPFNLEVFQLSIDYRF